MTWLDRARAIELRRAISPEYRRSGRNYWQEYSYYIE